MRVKRYWKPALVLLAAAAILVSAGRPASAQQGRLQLTTSPLPISLKTKPGQAVSANLRVQNSGSQTENLKIDLYKFRAFGDSGKPQLIDREPGDSFFDWVSFSRDRIRAEPNVWNTVRMTINVPNSAAFGYYYAVVFSRAGQAEPAEEGQTAFVGGSATLVLLDVQVPGAKRTVEVTSFRADHKINEYLPVTFSVSLRNTGQVHVAPLGNIFIFKGDKQVGMIGLNQEGGNVLPASSRTFTAGWTDGFPVFQPRASESGIELDDEGRPKMSLKWDISRAGKFRIGPYSAKLVMAFNDGKRDVPVEGNLSFWVLPWKLLLIVLFVLLAILFGLWSTGRKSLKRAKQLVNKRQRDG